MSTLGMNTPDIFGARRTDFQVTCKTDRFAPDFQPGDQLFVRQQKTAEDGQMVVVMTEVDGVKDAHLERFPPAEGVVIGLIIGLHRSLS